MKNIFITGISGYLGKKLAQELIADKDVRSIVGIDIAPFSIKHKKITFYKKDIRDPGINNLMSDHKIHTVFHLAFVVKPIHNTKLMHDIDYNGTKNLLTAAYDSGVQHFIAISSTLAYGAHKDNPERLTENDPLRGNKSFPYGYNKAAVDNMIQDFAKSCPEMIITTLRPCTVFGPTVDNYVSRMLFMPFTVSIRGYNSKVQFLHEDDFVKACLIAMEKRSPGIFNIVGQGTLTTLEIAEIIGTKVIPIWPWILYPILEVLWQLHCPGIEINRGYLDYVRHSFVASPEKTEKQLGFYPEYTSTQTLKQAIKDKP